MNASRPSEFETAFAEVVQQRADALVVSSAVSLLTEPDQIVALAARHAVPAIYAWRPSAAVGGLISYATNLPDAWRGKPVSTPAGFSRAKNLPICRSLQPTKFELVINLKTAKALGLVIPHTLLLVAADEVIE